MDLCFRLPIFFTAAVVYHRWEITDRTSGQFEDLPSDSQGLLCVVADPNEGASTAPQDILHPDEEGDVLIYLSVCDEMIVIE